MTPPITIPYGTLRGMPRREARYLSGNSGLVLLHPENNEFELLMNARDFKRLEELPEAAWFIFSQMNLQFLNGYLFGWHDLMPPLPVFDFDDNNFAGYRS